MDASGELIEKLLRGDETFHCFCYNGPPNFSDNCFLKCSANKQEIHRKSDNVHILLLPKTGLFFITSTRNAAEKLQLNRFNHCNA